MLLIQIRKTTAKKTVLLQEPSPSCSSHTEPRNKFSTHLTGHLEHVLSHSYEDMYNKSLQPELRIYSNSLHYSNFHLAKITIEMLYLGSFSRRDIQIKKVRGRKKEKKEDFVRCVNQLYSTEKKIQLVVDSCKLLHVIKCPSLNYRPFSSSSMTM